MVLFLPPGFETIKPSCSANCMMTYPFALFTLNLLDRHSQSKAVPISLFLRISVHALDICSIEGITSDSSGMSSAVCLAILIALFIVLSSSDRSTGPLA